MSATTARLTNRRTGCDGARPWHLWSHACTRITGPKDARSRAGSVASDHRQPASVTGRDDSQVRSLYERVGGEQFFVSLIDRFYSAVAGDPVLRPLYPDDLSGPSRHLRLFLIQYWGGPTTYSDERGHPRLRMRHAPFVIGTLERDAWLRHMTAAVKAAELDEGDESELLSYFDMTARSLVNIG